MAGCEALVFSGISPERFVGLSVKAKAQGIAIEGHHGSASQFGATVTWHYDPETGNLTLQCISKPFFIGCEDINRRLRQAVSSSV